MRKTIFFILAIICAFWGGNLMKPLGTVVTIFAICLIVAAWECMKKV